MDQEPTLLIIKPLFLFVSYFLLFLFICAWHNNVIIRISQSISSAGNLTECWIKHAKPKSLHNFRDPLVHIVTEFARIPNVTICSDCSAGVFYKFNFLDPFILTPCFNLTNRGLG
uniref:Uncharacterized protein n=1 Tax=Prolemur simus TaxID=1328070 RepID=A0A8C9ABE1_PROSS